MQFTHVAYGGCWKWRHDWQRCSFSTPSFAASQKGFVHSFGTGIGLVTLLQSLMVFSHPRWRLMNSSVAFAHCAAAVAATWYDCPGTTKSCDRGMRVCHALMCSRG